MTSQRELVRKSPIGAEINWRFQEFAFRFNPSESPMSRALVAHGYELEDHPLHPLHTDSDWLASKVHMGSLSIIFRQPTPSDLLICSIQRKSTARKMSSPLLGVVEFIYFCSYCCPEVKILGGDIDKYVDGQHSSENLKMDRLIAFYNHLLGDIEGYESNGVFSIYADMHCKKRFETLPIWQRHRKKLEARQQA